MALLMAAFFILAAGAAALSYDYVKTVGNVQILNYQIGQVDRQMKLFQSLFNDTLEYAKGNPKIDPIFLSLGFKINRSATGKEPITATPTAKH